MKKLIAVSVATIIATGVINVSAANNAENKINFTDILECVKDNGICECFPQSQKGCNSIFKIIDFLKDLKFDIDLPDIELPDLPKPDEDDVPSDKPENDVPEIEIPEEKPDVPTLPEEKPEEAPDKEEDKEDTQTGGNISNNAYVNEILRLVNKERASNGLSAVSLDNALCSAAETRAREIVRSFSHTRPDGRSCFTVLSDSGISYNGAGENIAYGQDSAQEVMTAWMNSQGHRANILNGSFTKLGVGVYSSGSTLYFAQIFTY